MTPTIISLLTVTFGFLGLVLWVYWPSRKQELESLGQIPLDESDEPDTKRRDNS